MKDLAEKCPDQRLVYDQTSCPIQVPFKSITDLFSIKAADAAEDYCWHYLDYTKHIQQ